MVPWPQAIAFGDALLFAVPYGALPQLGRDYGGALQGKIVLDACNAVRLDLNRLDGLLETFYKRAIEKVDAQAGLLCVKIMERKAAMLGLDSPQQLDIVQVQAQKEPSQHDRIVEAVNRMWEQMPPAKRALHDRLDQLTPERALEFARSLRAEWWRRRWRYAV